MCYHMSLISFEKVFTDIWYDTVVIVKVGDELSQQYHKVTWNILSIMIYKYIMSKNQNVIFSKGFFSYVVTPSTQ